MIKVYLTIIQEEMEDQITNDLIRSYPSYSLLEDPITIIILGALVAFIFGVWFALLMNSKITNWEKKRISPQPLKNPYTVLSWSGAFLGLTLFFTGMLEVFAFSPIKSLIASLSIAMLSGTTMWRVIKELMEQLELGKVKEIDEYF